MPKSVIVNVTVPDVDAGTYLTHSSPNADTFSIWVPALTSIMSASNELISTPLGSKYLTVIRLRKVGLAHFNGRTDEVKGKRPMTVSTLTSHLRAPMLRMLTEESLRR